MQREADTEATEIVDTDVVDVATVAGTGSSGGGSRRNRQSWIIYHNYGETGHITRQCVQPNGGAHINDDSAVVAADFPGVDE